MKIIFFLLIIFSNNVMSQIKYISKTEIDLIASNSLKKDVVSIADSKGIYDKHIQLINLDSGKQIIYSDLLQKGYEIEVTEDYLEFMRHTTVPIFLQADISLFNNIEMNKTDFLKRIEKLKSKHIITGGNIDELSINDFIYFKKNKKTAYSTLVFIAGEKIRSLIKGKWELIIDENFFLHKPVIVDPSGIKYDPNYIVMKMFERNLPFFSTLISNYLQ
jgi:hypothetical protein